ncbi:MAG: GAF domain-containing protein, partial [Gammaproteobacteria bacterium]|nr:GAF domain-containing protein [Gammaproteobacteria bacterium]
ERKSFTETDLEILERFAVRAALTLQASRLFAQLGILHKISDYIQATGDIDKILHVILTGITAGYGLGFNRAAAFLLDERQEYLVGQMGIGCLNKLEAEKHWKVHHKRGLENFEEYRKQLEQGTLLLTPLEKRIRGLRLSMRPAEPDVFSRVMIKPHGVLFLTPDDLSRLPASFIEAFEPTLPLVAVPLLGKNQTIGIIVADNKFTQAPITPEDVESLQTFANTAAVAVDNFRLLQQNRIGREKLQSLFEASQSLVSNQEPRQVLQNIVEQTRVAANASWVRVILINERGQSWKQITGGTNKQFDLRDAIRPNGISMKVMRTGKAEVIEDTSKERERVNPFILENGIAATLCFPFSLQGKPIGVMWINYDEPHHFPTSEIDALQLYVNHAAIAYDAAQRVEGLEQLSQAAQAISQVSDLKQTLRAIVEEAVKVFQADFSTIWYYDSGGGQFLPEKLEAVGYSEEELQIFKEIEPQPGGWTYTTLRDGWVSVHDVSSLEYMFLTESKRETLRQYGMASFQAIALNVGDEPIGVLSVSYRQPRTFVKEDRRSLESFAAHAALSLRNAKLLDQVSKAKTAARVVAQVTTLGDHNATLGSIVMGIREVVRCDAVVLYVYNQATNKLDYPPTMVGVRYQGKVTHFEEVLLDSFVYKMLELDEPYIVEKIVEDDLFKDSRFAQAEGIESCVAITLKAVGQKVGVMFVNYRTPHRFTSEELTDIELFADQAAIAVRNTQLFEDAKKLREQEAMVELSKEFLSTMKQQEMLDRAVAVAADVLATDLASTVLPDRNGNLIFTAIAGCWKGIIVGETRMEGGEGSQTGFTLLDKEPVIVDNYAEEIRFTVPSIVFENGIKSSMGVPMFSGDEGDVVGAMYVHTRKPRNFSEADKTLLSLIANQTAIAIKSAQQYEAIERKRAHLSALYEASKAITVSFGLEPKQILDCIAQQAMECVIGSREPATGFCTIWLVDETKNEMHCESIYPYQVFPNLADRIGEKRFLGEGMIGITGRAVKTKQPQFVQDVSTDHDYIVFNPCTKSELAVPLLDQDKIIGVLTVESEQMEAFDEDALNTLQALAELAVITIRNAQQFKELKETKGLVGSRTALAWTGMISSAWRHTIEMHAITIREQVQLLRPELARLSVSERTAERLSMIERLANRILEKPITPPLSVEEEAHSVSINDLIRDRTRQLWNNEPYKSILLDWDLALEDSATAHASAEWLRRCVDVLIDNAVEATAGLPERRITVASRQAVGDGEISVTDNGRGIPEETRARLFREPVKKPRGAKGLGIGLLFAQTIVQTYGGNLQCGSTGPTGTTMIISLPLET